MGRRPILGDKAGEFFAMRLHAEMAAEIDAYGKAKGLQTRSEAVRDLLLLGLATHYEAEHKPTAPRRRK